VDLNPLVGDIFAKSQIYERVKMLGFQTFDPKGGTLGNQHELATLITILFTPAHNQYINTFMFRKKNLISV